MITFKQFTAVALGLITYTCFISSGLAMHENKPLPINDSGRQMTITFFHFSKTSDAVVLPLNENLGLTLAKGYAAGVSLSNSAGLTLKSGVITINDKADYILKDSKMHPSMHIRNHANGKHTFLLSNGKGKYAIGYAPFMSITELNHALENYIKSAKQAYVHAIILANGNQCAFYKSNKGYHPFYLKELNSPAKVLAVKRLR
mgnify:CR=1 FL=1